jgi:hypothetical protein
MFGKRSQDPTPSVHYRCDRVSLINGHYFFSTRENTLEGPYYTRMDAERETEAYINRMIQAKASQQSSLNA